MNMSGPLLLVFAHPDDESSSTGGTTAKYTRYGVPVDLICATHGEKGTRLNVPPEVSTAVAREAGLRIAAGLMGIRDIYFLDYVDGEMEKADTGEVAQRVMDIMKKVWPEVVITFGPDGISRHPDHVTISAATTIAFDMLTERGDGPRKLYYVTIPESAVSAASGDIEGIATRPDEEITTVVDISGYLDTKIRALEAHSSQEDAQWLADMFRQDGKKGWGGKEFFYLARPVKSEKEHDIFE